MRSNVRAVLIGMAVSLMGVNAQAALIPIAGGLGVYDDVNNVTWAADGNLMATQAASYSGGAAAYVAAVIAASGGVIHDTPNGWDASPGAYMLSASDLNPGDGFMSWWGAKAWVNYLNITNYGGINTWALPTTMEMLGSYQLPPSPNSSQLAQLFYGGLGQVAGKSIATTHSNSYSLFANMGNYAFWSGTEDLVSPGDAWIFGSDLGYQATDGKKSKRSVLAVSAAQTYAVPEPGVAWLFGTGLLGVAGLRRSKTRNS